MKVINIEKGGEDYTNNVFDVIVMTDKPLPEDFLKQIKSMIESNDEPIEKTYPLTARQISDLYNAGATDNMNFCGLPSEFKDYMNENKATYLKEHFNITL
jgi:hypothetical protein